MKRFFAIAVASIASIALGCQSTDTAASTTKLTFQIVDHQASQSQKDAPTWVSAPTSEIEAMTAYQEKYAFKIDGPDSSTLDQAILAARQVSPAATISQAIKNRATQKFLEWKSNDKDRVKEYFQQSLNRVLDSLFEQAKLEKEFWIQIQYFKAYGTPDPERVYYRFVVLYSLPRKDVIDRIATAFDEQAALEKSNSTEDVKARDDLKRSFASGY